ncbi:MAG: hypothetical protein U0230_11250 [Polyangiales bacterium]
MTTWLGLFAACLVGGADTAKAELPPQVDGLTTYCLAEGVCMVGGSWSEANGFFSVTGDPKIRFPGGLEFSLGAGSASMRVGITPATASLTGTASLGYRGTGPMNGFGIDAGSVAVRFGMGRNIADVREFRFGSSRVRKQPGWFYFHASFSGEAAVRVPSMDDPVSLPSPAAGMSSQLLVGFDPANPGTVVFYLGGGFVALLTEQVVSDGAVLFAVATTPGAAPATTDLGSFRTALSGGSRENRSVTPNFQVEGTVSLGQRDDEGANRQNRAGSSSTQGTRNPPQQPPPPDDKPVPLTLAGMFSYDFDGNDDGIPSFVQGWRDTRYGGRISATLDDVGFGQSLSLGTGTFFVNPGANGCGPTGEILVRVDSVSQQMLAGTPLAFLDPGSAGYRFDARVCGRETMARLEAGTVAAGTMPLGNVVIGFGYGGIDVSATLSFLGSDFRLRGSVDRGVVRLSTIDDITIAGKTLAGGRVSVVLRPDSVAGRLRGYVTIAGRRFEIEHSFTTPPVDRIDTGEIDVSQRIRLDRLGTDALGVQATIELDASARAFVDRSSWGMRLTGGVGYEIRTWGPDGRDKVEGRWDTSLDLGSNGITTTIPGYSIRIAGTSFQAIPAGNQRFDSPDFDEPREQPPELVVSPSRAEPLTLAPNLRAGSGDRAPARVVRQDVIVTLEGSVEKSGGTIDLVGTLPRGLRPSNVLVFTAVQTPRAAGASGVAIRILPNGEIHVAQPNPAITALSLDGISFSRRPEDGIPLGLGSGVVAAGGDFEGPSAIGRGAFVRLQGAVRRASGNGPWTQIVRLPDSLRRISLTLTFELMSSAGAVRANLTEDGWLTYKSGPANFDWISLSGIEFTAGSYARRSFDYARGVRDDTTGMTTPPRIMGMPQTPVGNPTFLGARVHRFGGLVWLQGTAEAPDGNINLIGTLTPSMRPAQRTVFHVPQGSGITAEVHVLPNGEVRLVGGQGSRTWVSLCGVRFYANGAQDELVLVRQAIVDFSLELEDGDMKDDWNAAEGGWRDQLRAATTVDQLRASIHQLVDFMPRSALRRAWTDQRDPWRAELAAAATPADIARSIRQLARLTKWSVLDDDWDDLVLGWRNELDGYASR